VTSYSSVEDLSTYTIQAISEPKASDGGCYYVESFRCSNREMAETYRRLRGFKVELKCLGSVENVDEALGQARASIPRTRFMEYNGLAFMKHLLRGSLDYDPCDSRRWSHIKQTGLAEWLEANSSV
jgi:hypothetical protein